MLKSPWTNPGVLLEQVKSRSNRCVNSHDSLSSPVLPKAACEAMFNISQYANYAISNATGEPTDCVPAGKCQEMTCYVGRKNSSITFITLPCDVPPSVKTVVTNPTGEVMFYGTITNFESLMWSIDSLNLNVNVTVQHPNRSAIALQVSFAIYSGPLQISCFFDWRVDQYTRKQRYSSIRTVSVGYCSILTNG